MPPFFSTSRIQSSNLFINPLFSPLDCPINFNRKFAPNQLLHTVGPQPWVHVIPRRPNVPLPVMLETAAGANARV